MQQAIEQRTAPVTRSRMHHQTYRLVNDNQRRILMDKVQRHGLRRKRSVMLCRLRFDQNMFIAEHDSAHFGRFAIDQHTALLYPLLQSRAGEPGQQAGEHLVKPHALAAGVKRQCNRFELIRHCDEIVGIIQCFIIVLICKVGLTVWSDRKSTRLNFSHVSESRMPSSA